MTAILIDDERPSREALSNLLNAYCPGIVLLGQAENGASGLELIRRLQPELIFLDVEMPDMDGFEVLRRLGQAKAAVIFITAHHRYAVQAFEMSAMDYLLKPIGEQRLIEAVHKAGEHHRRKNLQQQYELLLERIVQQNNPVTYDSRIAFSMMNEVVFSWLRNIIWIQAKGNMSFVRLADHARELLIAKNIGEYVRLFSDCHELKSPHRSFLANRNQVKRYLREGLLEMSDGKQIPVATDRRAEIMAWLGEA